MVNRPIKVLLVEDSPGDARIIEETLTGVTDSGFAFHWVDRLSRAMEYLKETDVRIILLDLSLPDSHGLDTFGRIHAEAPDIPIIVLTGLDDEEVAVRTVHQGAQDYLIKGCVDGHLLVRAMRYAIERKDAQKALSVYADELRARNVEMETELSMAREIQMAFLPKDCAVYPQKAASGEAAVRVCHRYEPTEALAGDFFDILEISDAETGVLISDVVGHGVRAALITTFLRGLVERLRPVAANPGLFLTEMNRSFMASLHQSDFPMFASVLYLVLDVRKTEVRCANAGHPTPLRVRPDRGLVEALSSDHRARGPALGLVEDFAYSLTQNPAAERDWFLLFTDGLYEVENPNGEQFGEERLLASVRRGVLLPPNRLLDELLAEIRDFSGHADFKDDVCMVSVEVARARQDGA
ncbi:MAG TPA: SpoIIE family protein phosphatase [Sumerlaeia bacterium]|nr:SpoIIE family protein phosphatase [Sumerlaeia bacterium]